MTAPIASSPARRSASRRVDGFAVFAGVAFAIALIVIAALERVGAPDGFVRALGPIAALLGVVAIGIAVRASNLAAFAAAGRAAAPIYGGLAFVAVAAGLTLALLPLLTGDGELPREGFVAGFALAAFVGGPLLRAFGAAGPGDVFATLAPSSAARLLAGLVLALSGALLALAGFESAVDFLIALGVPNRRWAEVLIGAALLLSAAPGGLAGVLWCGAASGGGLAIIAALAAGIGWLQGLQPLPDLSALTAGLSTYAPTSPGDRVATEAAMALALGSAFALTPGATASPTTRSAVLSGVVGLAAALALAALTLGLLPLFSPDLSPGADASPARVAWFGAAGLFVTTALSRAGLVAAARALGLPVGVSEGPFPPLASVRLARMRLAILALVLGCAWLADLRVIDPPTAAVGALALPLALVVPSLILSVSSRFGSLAAATAMLTGFAVLVYGAVMARAPLGSAAILRESLAASVAALIVGWLVTLAAPRRIAVGRRRDFDRFAEPL